MLPWLLVVAAVLLLVVLMLMEDLPNPRTTRLMRKIPGPKDWFLIGCALEVAALRPHQLLPWAMNRMKNYPRFMKSTIIGRNLVYLFRPEDIQVLLSSSEHLSKGIQYRFVTPWLKSGLLTSTDKKWHERRKMLTPTFHFRILEDSMKILNNSGQILCKKLKGTQGEPIAVEQYISLCTLDVICESAMGIHLGAQEEEGEDYVNNIKRLTELIMYRAFHPILFTNIIFYASKAGKEFSKCLFHVHEFTKKVISDRKVNFCLSNEERGSYKGKQRKAFLDSMLEVETRNPGTLSDADIQEEVDTFMFEGHDTTSSALNFIFFNLGTYQEIQDNVFEEVSEIFGDKEELTIKDLQKMTYLEKVIKESLRIFPSVPFIARKLHKDIVLNDGVIIPCGVNVVLMQYKIHRNEDIFPDPEKFEPERFSEDESRGRHPFAYIPFSAGPRNCIGQKFAMMELKSVVSRVIRDFRVEAVTKREDFNLIIQLTLKTDVPIKCRFIPR